MISKESADLLADELVDAYSAPIRERRRARLERRYARVFGKELARRCADNPEASEEAMRKGRTQWEFAVCMAACLMLTVISAFLGSGIATVCIAVFSALVSRTLYRRYARRHFNKMVV
ncbi:MAG: hypothetical protein AAFY29_12385 [Pseudomonadota bacterium]